MKQIWSPPCARRCSPCKNEWCAIERINLDTKEKSTGNAGIFTCQVITMATQTLTTTSNIGTARPKWTLLQRLWNAMIKAQQARADQCIADYLQNIGWKLTDSAEREIERRSSSKQ